MPALTIDGDRFLLDGRPFQIRSGEMHYPRVPRACWRDRMRKLRAMGLNTLCTYVFWNLHEPEPEQFDFSGQLDLAEYLRTAQEEGLLVIVRPGPYICTELDFGGFPGWLMRAPDMQVRSLHPAFMSAVERYLARVGRELSPLLASAGGPIVLTQVENEYGSFGADHAYMAAIRDLIRGAGFDGLLFTSDGAEPSMLAGGTLPDVLSVINFGGDSPAPEFEKFAAFRTGVPRMCGEYWIGWFDHWGEEHHTTEPEAPARGVAWMMEHGISFSLYMAHGGTSFGWQAGANFGERYEPDITSYDYDAPLDEAGRPTAKYYAIRTAIAQRLPAGEELPPLPAPAPMLATQVVQMTPGAALIDQSVSGETANAPLSMESLGLSYGFVLYRHTAVEAVRGRLYVDVRDFAHVIVNGALLGVLDRREPDRELDLELAEGDRLELVVENMARVNYGRHMVGERKGILGPVRVDRVELSGWEHVALPFAVPESAAADGEEHCLRFWRGDLTANVQADTFIDMRGWPKGHVWLNGIHLGRFWEIGPQYTLFAPGSWMREGANDVHVLSLGDPVMPALRCGPDPVFRADA